MPYPIDRKLVVGVSSNALFDLEHENEIYKNEGIEKFRQYQIDNKSKSLSAGIAMPFIRRFLSFSK